MNDIAFFIVVFKMDRIPMVAVLLAASCTNGVFLFGVLISARDISLECNGLYLRLFRVCICEPYSMGTLLSCDMALVS